MLDPNGTPSADDLRVLHLLHLADRQPPRPPLLQLEALAALVATRRSSDELTRELLKRLLDGLHRL